MVEAANTDKEEDSGEVGEPEEPVIHPCLGEAVGEALTVVTALNDDVTEEEIYEKNLWGAFKIKTLKKWKHQCNKECKSIVFEC